MHGMNGLRLLCKGAHSIVEAPQQLVKVAFPSKTTLCSKSLCDTFGRPVYRKDSAV